MRFARLGIIVLLLNGAGPALGQDLRDQYNTQSLEAAKLIEQTIRLAQMKKAGEALKAIDAAIQADPRCQMAHYWRAIVLKDTGDVESALEAYKTALSEKVNRRPMMSANAALNLAITLGKLKEYDEACLWFTRAIMEDSTNKYKMRGKAYRNLAITLKNQNKPFSAALAVAFAYDDKAPNTPYQMVRAFLNDIGNQEAARVLQFRQAPAKLEQRERKSTLAEAADALVIAPAIQALLPDPGGRYVLAWPGAGADYYFSIDTTVDKPTVRKVDLPHKADFPCLVQGALYVLAGRSIEKLDAATGKVLAGYGFGALTPTSLVVLPAQRRAYVGADKVIHEIDLNTGKVQKTNIPGQLVVAHPDQQSVYTWLKPDRVSGGGHVIINGRPVFFRTGTFDWSQTTLFQARLVPSGLLLAEVRENVASNAQQLSVSPNGRWIAVAGGGGWRPTVRTLGYGYGVAVFDADDFEHVQGFFQCDGYPQGVSFNPVTNQVAVIRGQDAKIYHLSDTKERVELKGKFASPSAWSGNGKFLFVAKQGGGVAAFTNELSSAEQTVAQAWAKRIVIAPIDSSQGATKSAAAQGPVAGFDSFEVGKPTRADVAAALAKVVQSRRNDRPAPWNEHAAYQNAKQTEALDEVRGHLTNQDEIGIAIFKLKRALKGNEKSVPLMFYLGEAYRLANRPADAEKLLAQVVRLDAGRTNLSCLALNNLATLIGARDNSLPALECLAKSLYLDRANPQTIAMAAPMMKKLKFNGEAQAIAKFASGAAATIVSDLPKLPAAPEAKMLTSAEVYQKAVWSVVLIKTNDGSGSGFCVGSNDIILTNNHVVAGTDLAEVYPFIIKDKSPVKMPMIHGQVVYRSEADDIAVLKLAKAPDYLAPLFVAAGSPSPGEKVYAIGSPGLGRQILEQSISEGLVSSKSRTIERATYLQHSAPVNPGNSGGPLLDDRCRVVGVVTLKAQLANVGFAVPAESLRRIFKTQ